MSIIEYSFTEEVLTSSVQTYLLESVLEELRSNGVIILSVTEV